MTTAKPSQIAWGVGARRSKVFAVQRAWVQAALASVVAALVGCGAQPPSHEADQQTGSGAGARTRARRSGVRASAPGVQLARVPLERGGSITYYEVPRVGLVMTAQGPAGRPLFDRAVLAGRSIEDNYRLLAKQEPPAALVAARQRLSARALQAPDGRATFGGLAPTRASEHGALGSAAKRSSLLAGNGSELHTLAVYPDDAAWFTNTYCSEPPGWHTFDSVWCPVDYWGWAATSSGPVQKYYEAAGATTTGSGVFYLDYWEPSSGEWVNAKTVELGVWAQTVVVAYNGAYRAGIYSVPETEDNPVYLAERYRDAVPQITEHVGDNPDARSFADFADEIQGITHSPDAWYITRNEYPFIHSDYGWIGKQPFSDFNANPFPQARMTDRFHDAGIRHFGDLVYAKRTMSDGGQRALLYVAMDGDSDFSDKQAVGIYTTDLQEVGYRLLPNYPVNQTNPFLAYNPRNDLFYAWVRGSAPDGAPQGKLLQYKIDYAFGNIDAQYVGEVPTSVFSSQCIQGGKTTPHGNLLVSVGCGDQPFGILIVDPIDGNLQSFYGIDPGASDEFEGIDVVDLDADPRTGGSWGQIHIQQLNGVFLGSDELWLAHYRVDDPSKL